MSFKVIALLIVCALAAMFAIAEAAPSENVCSLPPKSGECLIYLERWAYDANAKACVKFIYGGCNGNANNFKTERECLKTCA